MKKIKLFFQNINNYLNDFWEYKKSLRYMKISHQEEIKHFKWLVNIDFKKIKKRQKENIQFLQDKRRMSLGKDPKRSV